MKRSSQAPVASRQAGRRMNPAPVLALWLLLCSTACAQANHIERYEQGAGTAKPTAAEDRVVFFGTSSCSRCNLYKARLEAWGVDFVYVDIADQKHSTLMWHVVRKARPGYRGSVGIPVIDTGDEVLIAPKYNDLQARFAPKP